MKIILYICTSIVLASSLHAATWTVDNVTSRPANFRTIQAAIDAAAVGDTLLIAPSGNDYSGFTLTKRLNIKGTGASTSLPLGQGRVNISGGILLTSITATTDPNFGRNAGGSLLESLNFSSFTWLQILPSCSGVTIKRVNSSNTTGVQDDVRGDNTVILNSWFPRITVTGNNFVSTRSFFTSGVFSNGANVLFESCNIGFNTTSGNPVSFSSIKPQIRNSILISSSEVIAGANDQTTFDHCLAIGYQNLPSGSGNISLAANAFSTVFVGNSGSAGHQLKLGSPAIGARRNGVDMGVWGGSSPFIQDLVPALPRVTSLVMPAVVPDSAGLTFEVSAEARE